MYYSTKFGLGHKLVSDCMYYVCPKRPCMNANLNGRKIRLPQDNPLCLIDN